MAHLIGLGSFILFCWRLRKNFHYFRAKPFFDEVKIREYNNPGAKAAGLRNPLYSTMPFDYTLGDQHINPPRPDVETAKQLLKQIPELNGSILRRKGSPAFWMKRKSQFVTNFLININSVDTLAHL